MVYCMVLFPEASSALLLSPRVQCATMASRTWDATRVWQAPSALTEACGYMNTLEPALEVLCLPAFQQY